MVGANTKSILLTSLLWRMNEPIRVLKGGCDDRSATAPWWALCARDVCASFFDAASSGYIMEERVPCRSKSEYISSRRVISVSILR